MTVVVTDSNIYSKLLHFNDDKRHCIVQVWEWTSAQAECGERHHRTAACPWWPDSDESWPGVPDREHNRGTRFPQEEPRGGESSWPLPGRGFLSGKHKQPYWDAFLSFLEAEELCVALRDIQAVRDQRPNTPPIQEWRSEGFFQEKFMVQELLPQKVHKW